RHGGNVLARRPANTEVIVGAFNAALWTMKDLRVVLEVLVSAVLFFVYVMVMAQIVIDLVRDRDTGVVKKALWILGLLLFPFVAALLYLVVRGKGMAHRFQAASERRRAETSAYIRELAGPSGVEQISRA